MVLGAKERTQDGWSQRYMADRTQLGTLVEIRRHLMGAKRRSRWNTEEEIWDGIRTLLDDWADQRAAMDLPLDDDIDNSGATSHDLG